MHRSYVRKLKIRLSKPSACYSYTKVLNKLFSNVSLEDDRVPCTVGNTYVEIWCAYGVLVRS